MSELENVKVQLFILFFENTKTRYVVNTYVDVLEACLFYFVSVYFDLLNFEEENTKLVLWTFRNIKSWKLVLFMLSWSQRLLCCFSNRNEKVKMCHCKEIEHGCKNIISNFWGTDPPFRANLLFGCAQGGSERTSFSGSTVHIFYCLGRTPYTVFTHRCFRVVFGVDVLLLRRIT